MKKEYEVSSISRFLQRNPAWSQVVCVVAVALLIILGPIILYGLLFQPGPDSVRMLSNVPWWPVVILVALVALLSLLHGTTGVSVQKLPGKQKADGAAADSHEPSAPSKPGNPPAPSGPSDSPGTPGPPGQSGDPLRCTMQDRTLNGMSRVETNR